MSNKQNLKKEYFKEVTFMETNDCLNIFSSNNGKPSGRYFNIDDEEVDDGVWHVSGCNSLPTYDIYCGDEGCLTLQAYANKKYITFVVCGDFVIDNPLFTIRDYELEIVTEGISDHELSAYKKQIIEAVNKLEELEIIDSE